MHINQNDNPKTIKVNNKVKDNEDKKKKKQFTRFITLSFSYMQVKIAIILVQLEYHATDLM